MYEWVIMQTSVYILAFSTFHEIFALATWLTKIQGTTIFFEDKSSLVVELARRWRPTAIAANQAISMEKCTKKKETSKL